MWLLSRNWSRHVLILPRTPDRDPSLWDRLSYRTSTVSWVDQQLCSTTHSWCLGKLGRCRSFRPPTDQWWDSVRPVLRMTESGNTPAVRKAHDGHSHDEDEMTALGSRSYLSKGLHGICWCRRYRHERYVILCRRCRDKTPDLRLFLRPRVHRSDPEFWEVGYPRVVFLHVSF